MLDLNAGTADPDFVEPVLGLGESKTGGLDPGYALFGSALLPKRSLSA